MKFTFVKPKNGCRKKRQKMDEILMEYGDILLLFSKKSGTYLLVKRGASKKCHSTTHKKRPESTK